MEIRVPLITFGLAHFWDIFLVLTTMSLAAGNMLSLALSLTTCHIPLQHLLLLRINHKVAQIAKMKAVRQFYG